tara:strand:- start:574 stop:1206 length:633 start_codon:yes stop_codon:yes gene_type:complete
MIEITDDFLPMKEFSDLAQTMMSNQFPWVFSPYVTYVPGQEEYDPEKEHFQFNHSFYKDYSFQSPYTSVIWPCLEKLYALAICGIKANLQTQTKEHFPSRFHIDIGVKVDSEKVSALTTGILYINPNNGWTEFEDGTKVESVPNRFVKFPANTQHKGYTCTDEKARILINFNYYEAKEIVQEGNEIRYHQRKQMMEEGTRQLQNQRMGLQ